jgi:glycosyltransferase involved in cell wall biosynthesis
LIKNIFHLAENVSFESGGLRTVVVNLHNYIKTNNNYNSIIITNQKEENDSFIEFPSNQFKSWNYSKEIKNNLKKEFYPNDILHLHGVFMHIQYVSSKLAKEKELQYIITPHGMLEPWIMNDKKLKKKLYFEVILKKIVSNSKVLHAITPLEKDNLFKLTKHKNIIEIPNFINHSDLPKNLNYNPEEEYLLSLGRIHPKKGLDILIEAMSKIENKKIKLKIVGTQNEYSERLKLKCVELNLDNRIEFVGSVFGSQKYSLYANAKAFIAPAYSEAIGMVNLEAAACKAPVITTYNTGISIDWSKNGGIMINPNVVELTKAINELVNCSTFERNQRGESLSDFVIKKYSWEEKGHLWNDLYDSF